MRGGQIGVISSPGAGSEFWFEISLERGTNTTVAAEDSLPKLRDIPVLVADRNRASQEVLKYYLSSFGMHVTCAT